jgi:hypothetical protein
MNTQDKLAVGVRQAAAMLGTGFTHDTTQRSRNAILNAHYCKELGLHLRGRPLQQARASRTRVEKTAAHVHPGAGTRHHCVSDGTISGHVRLSRYGRASGWRNSRIASW